MERGQAPFAQYRLPAGRHGLARELVAENQRLRLLGACSQAIAERGYAGTTSADVIRLAGVSSSAFYRHFDNLAACVAAAVEMAADCVREAVAEACEKRERGGDEVDRYRTAAEAVMQFAAAEPALARLLGPAMPWPIPAAVEARRRLVEQLADLDSTDPLLISGALAFLSHRHRGSVADSGPAPEMAELLTSKRV